MGGWSSPAAYLPITPLHLSMHDNFDQLMQEFTWSQRGNKITKPFDPTIYNKNILWIMLQLQENQTNRIRD